MRLESEFSLSISYGFSLSFLLCVYQGAYWLITCVDWGVFYKPTWIESSLFSFQILVVGIFWELEGLLVRSTLLSAPSWSLSGRLSESTSTAPMFASACSSYTYCKVASIQLNPSSATKFQWNLLVWLQQRRKEQVAQLPDSIKANPEPVPLHQTGGMREAGAREKVWR